MSSIAVTLSTVFFFQAEDGIRDPLVTGVQTCALPISIAAERENIARDLALEQGKPYRVEALGEIDAAVSMWRDAGEIIKHLNTEVLPSTDPNKRIYTIRQPHGVYGVITPWNFPATIPTEYLCAGLVAGNTIVWKPSEYTPLTAIHI